jgi:hypothetical protein
MEAGTMALVKERTLTAEAPVPEKVLDEHQGKWVALRGGEVVGVAKELGELMKQADVRRDDLTYHVPSSSLTR